MVGDHAIRRILEVVEYPRVRRRRRDLLNRGEDRREHIGVIVAGFALQDRRDALEAHAGIYMLGRQRRQGAIRPAIKLDKNEVPYLYNIRRTLVYKPAAALVRRAVIVNLGAGAARAGFAHFPEVILLIAHVNVRRVDVRLRAPQRRRLVVRRQILLHVALKDGRVQPAFLHAPHFRQQLPRPADRLLFEVIAERPVAEHLEERVVISVLAHIVEVVVLAAGSDALLRIGRALVRPRACAEKYVFELIHAGVGEQQGRVVMRHDAAGRHGCMSVFFHEEVDELLTDFVGAAHGVFLW